jgi:hypothetical protein
VEGPRVGDLFTPEALSSAVITAGARVLLINGRTPGSPVRARGPRLLYLEIAGQRFFAAVEEPRS